MSDFTWGLMKLGHEITVLSNNAEYLGPNHDGPSGELVKRILKLKGSFEGGVTMIQQKEEIDKVSQWNVKKLKKILETEEWDGFLVGNLDLIGPEILKPLVETGKQVVQHIGFINEPFPAALAPSEKNFTIATASNAVKESLVNAGFRREKMTVIYPGTREDLLGANKAGRDLPVPLSNYSKDIGRLGTSENPLKICFAGLLMASKGAHTLIEAMVKLKKRGLNLQATIAGTSYQKGYVDTLKKYLMKNELDGSVIFCGNLARSSLTRMFVLHHIGVFTSIYPEAFGIVGAEIQASGLVLVTSGVGGAKELVEDGVNGLMYEADNSTDLANKLQWLAENPSLMKKMSKEGKKTVREKFSVLASSKEIEKTLSR